MLYSLIMPVYNRPDEVDELLKSLSQQDYTDKFEVVIVEDGSSIMCDDVVKNFNEKPRLNKNWINGGFFVLNKSVLKRIIGDQSVWEQQPLKSLVMDKQLIAYKHRGFWKCMDTLKDKNELNELWNSNKASWKNW